MAACAPACRVRHLLFTVLLFCVQLSPVSWLLGLVILLTMCLAPSLETIILPSPERGSSSPGGSHYGPFSDLFFMPFSNTLLETMLEPLDAILVSVGCHFVSILGALGHKNEVRNASPSSTGQTPKFAYSCTLFTIFMIPKAVKNESKSSRKARGRYKDKGQ